MIVTLSLATSYLLNIVSTRLYADVTEYIIQKIQITFFVDSQYILQKLIYTL